MKIKWYSLNEATFLKKSFLIDLRQTVKIFQIHLNVYGLL
jgi:hypothetical protein